MVHTIGTPRYEVETLVQPAGYPEAFLIRSFSNHAIPNSENELISLKKCCYSNWQQWLGYMKKKKMSGDFEKIQAAHHN